MLEEILGNESAQKVMYALYEYREIHASGIAGLYATALDPIKKQLEKFERAHILESRMIGRAKLYRFNQDHPLVPALVNLIAVAYQLDQNNLSFKKTHDNVRTI